MREQYSNEELRIFSKSDDATMSAYAKEMLENRLEQKRFIKGTLVAWLAILISAISLFFSFSFYNNSVIYRKEIRSINRHIVKLQQGYNTLSKTDCIKKTDK